ncbi:hypothetical protein [Paraliobacillus ryukyuensis]|uniref:hypothetical protein n=1 Tax=Paraliobacillus ryukyuensis TaxID=200904 RepID=UPI0009A8C06E|nr:hypothetical protein [Paraliobacillus ryukyuensis]
MNKFKLSIFILLIFFVGCSNQNGQVSNGEFSIGNVSSSELEQGKEYFIVMPFEWSGKQPVKIKSINIMENDTPITSEAGIAYKFYVGDQSKKTGVYMREDIGEKEPIDGFKIKDSNTLILELSLSSVQSNPNRALSIKYIENGEEKEQTLQSSLLSNLKASEQ